MTPEKALKLADIGFVFEVKPRKEKLGISSEGPSLEPAAARAASVQKREALLESFEAQTQDTMCLEEEVQQDCGKEAEQFEMTMQQHHELQMERFETPTRQQQMPLMERFEIPGRHQQYGQPFFNGQI